MSIHMNGKRVCWFAAFQLIFGLLVGWYYNNAGPDLVGVTARFWALCAAGFLLGIAAQGAINEKGQIHETELTLTSCIGSIAFIVGVSLLYKYLDLLSGYFAFCLVALNGAAYWLLTTLTTEKKPGPRLEHLQALWKDSQLGSIMSAVPALITGIVAIVAPLVPTMTVIGAILLALVLLGSFLDKNPGGSKSKRPFLEACAMAIPFGMASGLLTLQWVFALYGGLYGIFAILLIEGILHARAKRQRW